MELDLTPEGAVPVLIDGTLDLHTFQPGEDKELVTEYLAACRARGILQVWIGHGKGSGALRATVQALLPKLRESSRSARRARMEAGGEPRS